MTPPDDRGADMSAASLRILGGVLMLIGLWSPPHDEDASLFGIKVMIAGVGLIVLWGQK